MPVAVRSNRHRVVKVFVMIVIVAMRMLVFHCVMFVSVGVSLGQVD
jgi:hypothetical protein